MNKKQYMFQFRLRFDAFDIFEVLNFLELVLAYSFYARKSLIFGLSSAYFLSLDLQAGVEIEFKCRLSFVWHVLFSDNALCPAVNHCT